MKILLGLLLVLLISMLVVVVMILDRVKKIGADEEDDD